MTTSADWIDKFLRAFVRRLDPPEWPKLGTDEHDDFRSDWIDALDRRSVTEEEAGAALRRLREDPPQWLREHLPKFCHAVEVARKERVTSNTASDRDQAFEASKTCPRCSGSGQIAVFDRHYDGLQVIIWTDLEGKERRRAGRVVAHCECAMGRWMRSKIRDLDVLAKTPDFIEILAGRSRWLAEDPTGDEPGHEYRAGDARRMRAALGEKLGAR
jgi:hypothetical protein